MAKNRIKKYLRNKTIKKKFRRTRKRSNRLSKNKTRKQKGGSGSGMKRLTLGLAAAAGVSGANALWSKSRQPPTLSERARSWTQRRQVASPVTPMSPNNMAIRLEKYAKPGYIFGETRPHSGAITKLENQTAAAFRNGARAEDAVTTFDPLLVGRSPNYKGAFPYGTSETLWTTGWTALNIRGVLVDRPDGLSID